MQCFNLYCNYAPASMHSICLSLRVIYTEPCHCLTGFIISEANRLNGVWLLARCADLKQLDYSVANFHLCLLMLVVIGLLFRGLALLGVYSLNRNRQV